MATTVNKEGEQTTGFFTLDETLHCGLESYYSVNCNDKFVAVTNKIGADNEATSAIYKNNGNANTNQLMCAECNEFPTQHWCKGCKKVPICTICCQKRGNDNISNLLCKKCDNSAMVAV